MSPFNLLALFLLTQAGGAREGPGPPGEATISKRHSSPTLLRFRRSTQESRLFGTSWWKGCRL